MEMTLSIANSDYFVLEALKRLGNQRVTYKEIADACKTKCSLMTVYRSLKRLQDSKVVKQVSRSKAGCIYEVVTNAHA